MVEWRRSDEFTEAIRGNQFLLYFQQHRGKLPVSTLFSSTSWQTPRKTDIFPTFVFNNIVALTCNFRFPPSSRDGLRTFANQPIFRLHTFFIRSFSKTITAFTMYNIVAKPCFSSAPSSGWDLEKNAMPMVQFPQVPLSKNHHFPLQSGRAAEFARRKMGRQHQTAAVLSGSLARRRPRGG